MDTPDHSTPDPGESVDAIFGHLVAAGQPRHDRAQRLAEKIGGRR